MVFNVFGRLEGHSGSLEELWIELLAHWMAAGWLADGLAGGGWGWLGGWLATGTPGAEGTTSGEGDALVWGGPEPPFIKKPTNYPNSRLETRD